MTTNARHAPTSARAGLRRGALAAALTLLAACSSNKPGTSSPPALQALAITPSTAYLAVGGTQQLAATGRFSDGTSAAVTSGLGWSSSDVHVATVDANGVVTAVASGTARITAAHASGASAGADLTARVVTTVGASDLPRAAHVETTVAIYRVTGLTSGAFYAPSLTKLDDDVDLAVYADLSLSEAAQLCASQNVATAPESCAAPASASGELYLVVDGSWTEEGSGFQLGAAAAPTVPLDATLAWPAQLPFAGAVGTTAVHYKVTGLTPAARYAVRISGLTDDADLEVYADGYQYRSLCASYLSGRVDDACTAAANAQGELYVEVDGESTAGGASFSLAVAPAP